MMAQVDLGRFLGFFMTRELLSLAAKRMPIPDTRCAQFTSQPAVEACACRQHRHQHKYGCGLVKIGVTHMHKKHLSSTPKWLLVSLGRGMEEKETRSEGSMEGEDVEMPLTLPLLLCQLQFFKRVIVRFCRWLHTQRQ
jgi:hypothetical protein